MSPPWSSTAPLYIETMSDDDKRALARTIRAIVQDYQDYFDFDRVPIVGLNLQMDPRLPQTRSGLFVVTTDTLLHQLLTPWGGLTFPLFADAKTLMNAYYEQLRLTPFAKQVIRKRQSYGDFFGSTRDVYAVSAFHGEQLPKAIFAESYKERPAKQIIDEWNLLW
jgi:hypothetical protein